MFLPQVARIWSSLIGGYKIVRKMRFFFIALFAASNVCLTVSPSQTSAAGPPESVYREHVYLHTDRDLYIAGEYMNYHAYLLNGKVEGKNSGFVYLALRDEDRVIKRATLSLDAKQAAGSLYLPDTLSTGLYELTAYTNWMRNQGEDHYFYKTVWITNRFDSRPDLLSRLTGLNDPPHLSLTFAPEGGNFVTGVDNRMLVQAAGDVDAALRDVWILNQDQDTVAHAILNVHGLAVFSLIPEYGHEYHAITEGFGQVFPLPDTETSGCVLQVQQVKDILEVSIQEAGEDPPVQWWRIAYQGRVVHEEYVSKTPMLSHVALDDQVIPGGLLSVEAGGQGTTLMARRYWYNDHPGDPGITLRTDSDTWQPREKVSLTLDGSALTDDHASLSVSVVPEASLCLKETRFDSYTRTLEVMDHFGHKSKETVSMIASMDAEVLNQYLMLSHVKEWKTLQDEEGFSVDYYLETRELILTGRVLDRETGQAVPEARVVLNTPDSIINILYAETGDDGRFHFLLSDFFHNKALYLFVDPGTITGPTEIELIGKFTFQIPAAPREFPYLEQKADYINKSQDIVKVNKAYAIDHLTERNKTRDPVAKPPLLYGKARQTIYTDNYFALDSLPEIAREIIHPWQLRLRGGQYVSRLVSASDRKRLPGSPVYFLDGIITHDIDKMIHLDSETIFKIEVHNHHWVYGEMFFPGIIGLFTRNQEYQEIMADRTTTAVFKETLHEPMAYVPPAYDHPEDAAATLPDLRQLLFWQPGLLLEKEEKKTLEFYLGDLRGDFLIVVQGITPGGRAVYIKERVTIR